MISRRVNSIILLILLAPLTALCTHTGNRYFLFLEKPEDYVTKKQSFFDVSAFYQTASTAFKSYGSSGGIPELYGQYNLRYVIKSLQEANPTETYDPIYEVTGSDYYKDKNLMFGMTGKVDTVGLTLDYEQNLKFANLKDITLGIWFPVMNMDLISRYQFNKNDFQSDYGRTLNDSEVRQVDEIRQLTHKYIGFEGTNLSRTSVGDIDIHLRWNYFIDHKLMMRGIALNLQGGVIIPTAKKMNIDYPTSIPFMNDGRWGIYLDFVPEFELKQDLKIGLILGGLYQFDDTQTRRLAIGKEPTTFSALVGKVKIDPGTTFKLSPYLSLENLADGVNIQLRYTYLRHSIDEWHDERIDQSIKSYLETTPHADLTKEELEKNLSQKAQLSKWRAQYFTIQVVYDSKQAFKNWFMKPKFYVSYDMPINGKGFSKVHQFTLGAQLFF